MLGPGRCASPCGRRRRPQGEQGCVLRVEDDGIGFDAAQRPPGHYGLAGMTEQAALMEGELDIDSRPGTGTRLTLRFQA